MTQPRTLSAEELGEIERDYYPSHEALSDLMSLLAERDAVGEYPARDQIPSWRDRWNRAVDIANDLVRVEP